MLTAALALPALKAAIQKKPTMRLTQCMASHLDMLQECSRGFLERDVVIFFPCPLRTTWEKTCCSCSSSSCSGLAAPSSTLSLHTRNCQCLRAGEAFVSRSGRFSVDAQAPTDHTTFCPLLQPLHCPARALSSPSLPFATELCFTGRRYRCLLCWNVLLPSDCVTQSRVCTCPPQSSNSSSSSVFRISCPVALRPDTQTGHMRVVIGSRFHDHYPCRWCAPHITN